jgi:hypothetical protein
MLCGSWGRLDTVHSAHEQENLPGVVYELLLCSRNDQETIGEYTRAPDALQTLNSLGVTRGEFAIFYFTVYALIPLIVWVGAGLVLVSRRSNDWMALLVSLFLILFQVSTLLSGLVPLSQNFAATSIETAPVWFALLFLLPVSGVCGAGALPQWTFHSRLDVLDNYWISSDWIPQRLPVAE